MNIRISAQKIELTDSMKHVIEEKFSKIGRFGRRILYAHVYLDVEKTRHGVNAVLKSREKIWNAEAEDPNNLYKAVDECVRRLEKQIRRAKMQQPYM